MKKSQAYILIILSGMLFGTQCLFRTWLEPFGFTSMQMTATRGIVSAVAVSLFLLLTNKKLFKTSGKEMILFFLSGLFMFLCAFFYYTAMSHTTVATAVVLMYTSPIYVLLFSVVFLKEKLTPVKAVAVVMMLVGAALVSGIAEGMDFNFLGVLFGLLAGISYGAYNIVTKIEMRRGNNPLTAIVYCYIFMGILAAACADLPAMAALTVQSPPRVWLVMLCLGFFTCAFPYLIYTVALKEVPAGTASALGLIDPMAAIVYSIVFLNQALTVFIVIGVVLILGAVFMISRIKE